MRREKLYDIHEAAALFDVTSRTLWTYIKQGLITPTEVRLPKRQVFFSRQDIDAQKLIALPEISVRLRVNLNTMRRLLNEGLLNPFRIGFGRMKIAWFREAQLPEIKKLVDSDVSAQAAAFRLIRHEGGAAKALETLEEPTRYGKWQVLGPVQGTAGKRKVWCRCECGRKVQVDLYNLRAGRSKSCIECQRPTFIRREVFPAGTRFGKWRIVRYEGRQSHRPMYLCRCECGTKRLVDGDQLKAGRTKGCGKCNSFTPAMELGALVRALREKAGGSRQAIALIRQVAKQKRT